MLNYKIENYAPAQNALGAMYSEGKGTTKDETHKAAEPAKKQTEEKTASEEGTSTHAPFLPWLPSGVAETPAQCSHINETAYHEWFDAGAMLTNIKFACGYYGHINAESTCRDSDSGRKYCKEYKINRKNEYFLALKNGWGKNCYMTNGKPSYIEQLENNVDLVVGLCSIIDPDLYKKENDHRKAIHNAIEKIINDALPGIDAEIKEQYEALAAQKAADKKAITPAN